jgi:hypothetical protein
LVTFIQYDEPALQAGQYTVTARQETNQTDPNVPGSFEATRQFAVAGERFSFDPSELAALYPPDKATGELSGVLPHVLFNRRTLPWERTAVKAPGAPWLAILLFDDGHQPTVQKLTAKDLIPAGTAITVAGSGSTVKGTGAMPKGYASYPSINPLDYGETPDDVCMAIDLDPATFTALAPTTDDLPYLAHIRETDTVDVHDTVESSSSLAVVLGNRVPADNVTAHAYLVSLENMEPLLPDDQGNPGSGLAGVSTVRLITYRWWSFTATTGSASFQSLLEGVNAVPPGQAGVLSSLQLPFAGARPTPAQVQQAMNDQAAGTVSAPDATVLAHNAFALGYVPLGHRLRHGGQTVSWYRGPLAPLPVTAKVQTPISCPDAASRYNPQTGMFDVSYAAAWQLGQLLGLQSRSYAVTLYNWRRHLRSDAVASAEQQLLENLLGGAFESVVQARATRLADSAPTPPKAVVKWLARLALLRGVPFNYLVPDERMLPPESLRMFHLDRAWIDALLDGAFSIGRVTQGELALDAQHAPAVRELVDAELREVRPNPEPADLHANPTGEITGFLLRSAAVSGWPNAAAVGYLDAERRQPAPKLRSVRLGTDVWLCLFDGVVDVVGIHEPPGQLHCGVEGSPGAYSTTLREVVGSAPGHQYDPPLGEATVNTRADGRTLETADAATSIEDKLNAAFGQGLTKFTSAEFALEMVKGVVEVEFRQGG